MFCLKNLRSNVVMKVQENDILLNRRKYFAVLPSQRPSGLVRTSRLPNCLLQRGQAFVHPSYQGQRHTATCATLVLESAQSRVVFRLLALAVVKCVENIFVGSLLSAFLLSEIERSPTFPNTEEDL